MSPNEQAPNERCYVPKTVNTSQPFDGTGESIQKYLRSVPTVGDLPVGVTMKVK